MKATTVILTNTQKTLIYLSLLIDCIEIIWGCNFCLYTKKTNRNDITDLSKDMYTRTSTYDGEEFLCKTEKTLCKGVFE